MHTVFCEPRGAGDDGVIGCYQEAAEFKLEMSACDVVVSVPITHDNVLERQLTTATAVDWGGSEEPHLNPESLVKVEFASCGTPLPHWHARRGLGLMVTERKVPDNPIGVARVATT